MQLLLAFVFLLATLMHHYGDWLIPLVPQRVYVALWGIWSLTAVVVITYSLFRRWNDWRAGFVMMLALGIGFIETGMIAVCKSWYAFVYVGEAQFGNTCTNMTGLTISPWLMSGFGLLLISFAIGEWMRSKGDEYSNQGYFVAYIKPQSVSFWKLLAMLFTFPYAGKCWVVDGIGYKYKAGRMMSFIVNPNDFRFASIDKRPNVWAGRKWSIFNNCVRHD